MTNIALQYAYNSDDNDWQPIQQSSSPSGQANAQAVFARVYGATSPFVDISAETRVSAAHVGTTLPITGPNPNDPNGLVTISGVYALNAALTSLVAGRMVDETAASLTPVANGSLRQAALAYAYDGTNFGRIRLASDNASIAPAASLSLRTAAIAFTFDGTNFLRSLAGSAANLAAQSVNGAQLIQAGGEWAINHTPVANTQATITRAAGAAGVRHVCKSITATLIGLAASTETTVLVNLRDGTTGTGTILWSARLLVTGTTGSQAGIALSNLNIVGSAATAMTLEFATAGGASTFETVALTGIDAS